MTKGEKMRLKLRDIMYVCYVESRCDVLCDHLVSRSYHVWLSLDIWILWFGREEMMCMDVFVLFLSHLVKTHSSLLS